MERSCCVMRGAVRMRTYQWLNVVVIVCAHFESCCFAFSVLLVRTFTKV